MNAASARSLLIETNTPEVEAAFEAVPAEMVAEILEGELYASPRPPRPHTRAASRLSRRLGQFDDDDGPNGWVILLGPELHLGPRPDKIVPDLAGWRRARMPDAIGPEEAPPYYDLALDWVGEILSPRTERVDRGKKMRIYRRESVGHVWLIHPLMQTLEVYRLEAGGWLLVESYEGDATIRAEPFEALELALGSLWAR